MYWFVALVMAAAAVWDWRYRRIPNRLTFPFLIAGILYHLVYEGWSGAGKAVAGMFVAGGILLCFYLLGATGAGDVKLAAGLGAWCGPAASLQVLAYAAVAGGLFAVLAVVYRSLRHRSGEPLKRLAWRLTAVWVQPRIAPEVVRSPRYRHMAVPYAVPIAVGFCYWLMRSGTS